MAAIAYSDIGVALRVKGATTYAVLIPITDCPPMGSEADTSEVTELQMTNKAYVLGRGGVDKLSFGFNWTPENRTALALVADSVTSKDFLVDLPDDSGYTFSGTSMFYLDSVDGSLKGKLVIAPSSPPVLVEDITALRSV